MLSTELFCKGANVSAPICTIHQLMMFVEPIIVVVELFFGTHNKVESSGGLTGLHDEPPGLGQNICP
jgi:hypothetical protein